MRSIALTQFGVELSAAELMEQAWQSVLAEMAAANEEDYAGQVFSVASVRAPILAGSSSFALAPAGLRRR